VEQALIMFADSPSLHFGPLGTITGSSEIRGVLEYDIAFNTQLQFEECEAAALEVTCRAVENNDWLRSVDIESITYDENKFTFSEDGAFDYSEENAEKVLVLLSQWRTG
jgi:hypothetical protein